MSNQPGISKKAATALVSVPLITAMLGYMTSSFLIPAFPFHSTILFSGLVYITIVLTLIYLLARKGMFEGLDASVVVMAFATMIAAIIFFGCSSNVSAVSAHRSAGKRIAQVKQTHGFEPAIAARHGSVQSLAQAQENITFLLEISSSSTSEKNVLNYLMASEIMGLDAEFVRLNGIVRDSDKKRLFQHIRTQALETSTSTDPAIARAAALAGEI